MPCTTRSVGDERFERPQLGLDAEEAAHHRRGERRAEENDPQHRLDRGGLAHAQVRDQKQHREQEQRGILRKQNGTKVHGSVPLFFSCFAQRVQSPRRRY